MVKTFRIPPWDVRHFSVATLATSPAPSQGWEGLVWGGEGETISSVRTEITMLILFTAMSPLASTAPSAYSINMI